jgi:hypothetical protein
MNRVYKLAECLFGEDEREISVSCGVLCVRPRGGL